MSGCRRRLQPDKRHGDPSWPAALEHYKLARVVHNRGPDPYWQCVPDLRLSLLYVRRLRPGGLLILAPVCDWSSTDKDLNKPRASWGIWKQLLNWWFPLQVHL